MIIGEKDSKFIKYLPNSEIIGYKRKQKANLQLSRERDSKFAKKKVISWQISVIYSEFAEQKLNS